MQIKIFGNNSDTQELFQRVNFSIEELGLSDFVQAEITQDETIKQELNISLEPALIIEEESIDFKDMIFEGIVPDTEELKSMFISIIGGGWDGGSCSTGGGCSSGSCGTGWCGSC